MAAWRLLSTNVPPKMALTTAAVKALIFPNYDGSQIIEAVQEEKEVNQYSTGLLVYNLKLFTKILSLIQCFHCNS